MSDVRAQQATSLDAVLQGGVLQCADSQPTDSQSAALSCKEVLDRDGLCITTTVGASMLPLLRQGRDIVVIQAFPQNAASDVKPRAQRYDVVLFKRGGKCLLHRVLRVAQDGYTTCGDHNVRCEKHVAEQELLGVLVQVDRDGAPLPVDMHWKERGNDKPPFAYRAYVHLWCDLYPVRAALLAARRVGGGAVRRARRVLKK